MGVRLRWTYADGGRGQHHVDVHTENLSPLTSSCLFSYKEVHIFKIRNKLQSYYSRISTNFQKVSVLAVSRDRCVFHVDGMWTSTGARGSVSCGRMWTEGVQ